MGDVSTQQTKKMTLGLDLGDNYSYLRASSTPKAASSLRKVGCALPLTISTAASTPQSR